ncbi:ABC transporter substrate-binding protein [Microlunatus panaciterrae]|uniref:Iron complex transport system substrate-binding protein n=1 Tax=Microlunatus panaciterrae TaxID=400768 RepID=A0ABS2RKK9_9ACTN|nr:ABC transporter substrate-binding protein [Microlunatus panaciterrae]MBM7799540.1 iron complex transport system substrate-binding protein [Microlunatus panaciterrae]
MNHTTTHRSPSLTTLIGTLAASAALLLAGCGTGTGTGPAGGPTPAAVGADGCITHFDAETDYYPTKQRLQYARNFTLSYHRSYQVLTVKQPVVGGKPESYVLVRCGAKAPALTGELAKATVLTTPVKSLFSASTTHIPSLEALGKLGVLTGVSSKAFISSKAAQQRVAEAGVTEFAPAGTTDAEKIVAAKPDVLVTGGVEDPAYATVRDAKIPVLADAEFLENDPLGRAEWIKYFAALTGTEDKATEVFGRITHDYDAAVALAKDAKPTEAVVSQPYQGVWSVPAGGSFMGRMLTDARGSWPYADDTSTGSIQTDLETVFAKSRTAPVWLTSSNWTTKKEALAEEPRFAEFAAFKSGQVWAPSLQVNASGGNNFYELGVLRPDLTITDLIAILHPDLMPDHTFTFYRQLR